MKKKSSKINIATYYPARNKLQKLLPKYTIEDCNAEKAVKLYNCLKELGRNAQIELFWGRGWNGIEWGYYLNLTVTDYSHHDSEGNEYCYSFDPVTGEEIPE